MCLSPEVDVIAGAAITGIGVATLLQVREKRDLIVAALPLGFGLHQLNEAFVWWGLRGQVSADPPSCFSQTKPPATLIRALN